MLQYLLKYIQYNIGKVVKLQEIGSFSELAKKLNDKEVIDNSKKMLQLIIMDKKNIHLKKFLSCFMIISHENVIISKNTELERNIIYLCNKIVNQLKSIIETTSIEQFYVYQFLLNLYYTKYIEYFDEWKDIDKVKIVNDLCSIYFELESDKHKKYEDIDNESNKQFIISIEREQEKIIKKIEKIDGNKGLEHLKKLQTEMEEYKKSIHNMYLKIQDNLHDAYWHSIQLELTKIPPNNYVICELLEQLKDMLLNCNKKLKEELDSKIDIPFIQDMIKHNAIDNQYIYNMCCYIMGFIEEYQSRAHDEDTQNWKQEILKMFEEGIVNSKFFPIFFRGVFERIETILREIDMYNFITRNIQK